jgi:hypothetical protein
MSTAPNAHIYIPTLLPTLIFTLYCPHYDIHNIISTKASGRCEWFKFNNMGNSALSLSERTSNFTPLWAENKRLPL